MEKILMGSCDNRVATCANYLGRGQAGKKVRWPTAPGRVRNPLHQPQTKFGHPKMPATIFIPGGGQVLIAQGTIPKFLRLAQSEHRLSDEPELAIAPSHQWIGTGCLLTVLPRQLLDFLPVLQFHSPGCVGCPHTPERVC